MTNKALNRIPERIKFIIALICFTTLPAALWAQPEEEPVDTSASYDYYDENLDNPLDGIGGGEEQEEAPKKPERRPYVRLVVPVDSLTELIAYDTVVEQEESYYDSLYLRAKRWVNTKWGTTNPKKQKDNAKLYTEDVLYEKFKAKVSVPLRVRYNKYSSSEYGEVQFTLIMRFKDGKYKYTFTNLTHLLPETSGKNDINYVYMEFYMRSERNVQNYDRYLRGADAAIKKLAKELKRAMREPVEIDEEDW